jgi:hypothetical protein
MDDMTMMSVQCNIILNNGYMCGIQAVGRCATCQRAFCMTHQGLTSAWRVPYIDMCAPCANAKQAEVDRRMKEARAPYEYFESGAARTTLSAAGVLTVDIYNVRKEWKKKKGVFGRSGYVDVATPFGRGWVLGEFLCAYTYIDTTRYENFLTALMDVEPKMLRPTDRTNNGLVPVQPYSGGYQIASASQDGQKAVNFVGKQSGEEGWREVMQAVKRLAGESS